MKVRMTRTHRVQIGDARGVRGYGGDAGDIVDVPADVASMLLSAGAAVPADTRTKADKPKGETATK